MKFNQLFLPLICLLTFCWSCTEDMETKENLDLIKGRWEVKEAFRNNKLTETMDGIYFNFRSDGKMVSNFNLRVADVENPYILKKDMITEEGKEKRSFKIEDLESSNLTISTKYQGLDFRFKMEKSLKN